MPINVDLTEMDARTQLLRFHEDQGGEVAIPEGVEYDYLRHMEGEPIHRGLGFKDNGARLVARLPMSLREEAWRFFQSRDAPGQLWYEIHKLPASIGRSQLQRML